MTKRAIGAALFFMVSSINLNAMETNPSNETKLSSKDISEKQLPELEITKLLLKMRLYQELLVPEGACVDLYPTDWNHLKNLDPVTNLKQLAPKIEDAKKTVDEDLLQRSLKYVYDKVPENLQY